MRRALPLPLAAAALAAAALIGCGPPADHFSIHLTLSQAEYRCPSPSCNGIIVACDAVVSVRIVDAADPGKVYLSKCLPLDNAKNLCPISGLDLTGTDGVPESIPNTMVRVEVLVWPKTELDDLGSPLQCPTDIEFDAHGMPLNQAPAPAIGGQTYFLVGSSEVADVPLGCINTAEIADKTCRSPGTVRVQAAVDDFDTGVYLPPSIADGVTVYVGEPRGHVNPDTLATEWELGPSDVTTLPRTVEAPVPAWGDDISAQFQDTACLEVLEDGPQETPAVSCYAATPGEDLQLRGFRLAKSTLAQAFGALRLPGVPDQGLVVGIVVDHLGNPVAGASVLPSSGTVRFLTADRSDLDTGMKTTASGMFVSRDVPFDATWTATDGQGLPPVRPPVGGLVVGKATIVFIELQAPPSNQ
jgi:hypothetical protein